MPDIKQKLGQLFFVSIKGYTLNIKTKKFLKELQPGGIILFENNIKDKTQLKKLIANIKQSIQIPPFVTCDQEGGSVERLRKVATSTPSLWGLSKLGLNKLLLAQKIIAEEMQSFGFNMTLAPVLDINSNPKNPTINTRAISNNPKVVSKFGIEIAKQYLKYKLIPVVKHFPGHGDLRVDSHISLPKLNKTKNELMNFEFLPFKKAISSNLPCLMISHIYIPSYEKNKKPASLSKKIINNLLRKKLGFKGLIITDDLSTMKAITKNYKPKQAVKAAIIAGSNMVLLNSKEKDTINIFKYISKEIRNNPSLKEQIDKSYKKIIKLKKRYIINKNKSKLLQMQNNSKLSHKIAKQVVHYIRREKNPNLISKKDNVEIIYPITQKLDVNDLVVIFKKLKCRKPTFYGYNLSPNNEYIQKLIKKLKNNSKKVLILFNSLYWKNQRNLVKAVLTSFPETFLVLSTLEYDIEVAPKAKNVICSYGPNYISLRAAFEKIKKD